MKAIDVRNWLGKYFLIVTAVLGLYLLVCGESKALPITYQEAQDAFEILIPVLVSQLVMIFKWFSATPALDDKAKVPIAPWVVKLPPMLVLGMLTLTIVLLVIGNAKGSSWTPNGARFKAVVTFAVSLLNVTTVVLVARFFEAVPKLRAESGDQPVSGQ